MRRSWLLGAVFCAWLTAAAITFAFPRTPFAIDCVLAGALALAPGVVAFVRGDRRAGALAAAVAIAIGALVVEGTWIVAHPRLHLDNATDAPMQVWVDGARATIVAPFSGSGEPPWIRVAWGRRRLGWSEVGASAPSQGVDATIAIAGDQLLSPAAAGCYWIEATSFGDASLRDVPRGPQPVSPFLHFDRIDVWFAENPATLRRSILRRGDVSVALQRFDQCMRLERAGCDDKARQDFVDCETALHGPSLAGDCFEKSLHSCAAEGPTQK